MKNTPNADYWTSKLQLKPHPEGGYFAETYRSKEIIEGEYLPKRYNGDRAFATGIYFLLESHQFSALHRIQSDEMWHFYAGSQLVVYVIHPDGHLEEIHLGNNPDAGETLQAVVPAGCWFGAKVTEPNAYALVGCTVAPGFDFADFELAARNVLIHQYPQHRTIITQLTRS